MSFGKKTTKKASAKTIKSKPVDKIRDNLISERIKGIVNCTDAGCCPIEYIHKKMSGVKNIEDHIKICSKQNNFILHRGWVYNKFWTIEDLNEISNDKIIVDDFDGDNSKIDNDLLVKLTALYQRENEPIKVTWFEGLINRGALHITEKELWQSLERLMRSGKIYEPRIGEFAPTFDSI